jgi:hypothetical protein
MLPSALTPKILYFVDRVNVCVFFLNSHSGGGVQAGSTRHVGH